MTSDANFDTQSDAEKQGGAPPPAAGDAGNSFLSNMLSGLDPMDEKSVKQFGADAQKIKELATAGPGGGGFAVEPGAGQLFIGAIDRFAQDTWPDLALETRRLADHPELGDSQYAQIVAAHDADAMSAEDGKSLLPNLTLLANGLNDLREAIVAAMNSYRKEDEMHSISFKAVSPE